MNKLNQWVLALLSNGRFLFLMILFLHPPRVLADEASVALFKATSDAFSGEMSFALKLNENGEAVSLTYRKDEKQIDYDVAKLSTGILLYQSGGKNVISIQSQNFDARQGGTLVVTYLNNGLQNTYDTFSFSLLPEGQNWKTEEGDANDVLQPFDRMYLKSKKIFGKVIGIDSITVQEQ